jgi:hypothetical protein
VTGELHVLEKSVARLTLGKSLGPRSQNAWSYNSTPQYAFMVWRLVKAKGLYLYLLEATCFPKPSKSGVTSRENVHICAAEVMFVDS